MATKYGKTTLNFIDKYADLLDTSDNKYELFYKALEVYLAPLSRSRLKPNEVYTFLVEEMGFNNFLGKDIPIDQEQYKKFLTLPRVKTSMLSVKPIPKSVFDWMNLLRGESDEYLILDSLITMYDIAESKVDPNHILINYFIRNGYGHFNIDHPGHCPTQSAELNVILKGYRKNLGV